MNSARLCAAFWALASVGLLANGASVRAEPPYQATGIKIGEVTDTSAIVWTRLTLREHKNPSDGPMVTIVMAPGKNKKKGDQPSRRVERIEYPAGTTVDDIRDAAPGTPGEVRVLYRQADTAPWQETAWESVDDARDFTRQLALTGLRPNTRYQVRVESRSADRAVAGQIVEGRFVTAPTADQPARVVFTVSTGQEFPDKDRPDGFEIYPQMLKLDPSFFVHTGDIVYYDNLAKDIALARYHWQRTYGLPTNIDFHRQVASYFIKDDHDVWYNDCWPTLNDRGFMYQFTFAQGQRVFLEQVPMGTCPYRTVRWGKDLQIWLMEGRDFRSPNNLPDAPDKTIWGADQKAWFKKTVLESTATFRVLISPTPLVGPDRTNKNDNHANPGFQHEGDELRRFIAGQKNLVVVCGDRHWQYVSTHPETGVREYSCGPASDQHAGGWNQNDFVPEYHRYLNVIGGFLAVTVDRQDNRPSIVFRHYAVGGSVKHEEQIVAE